MSRASNLTEQEWQDVERRADAGESKRALAKEFGMAGSSLREMLERRAMRPASRAEPASALVVPCPMGRSQTKNRTHKRPDELPLAIEDSAAPVRPRAGAVERHLAPARALIDSVVGLLQIAADACRGLR